MNKQMPKWLFLAFVIAPMPSVLQAQEQRVAVDFGVALPQAGASLTPVISGTWLNGCIPNSATVTSNNYSALIVLKVPPLDTFCSQALTNFRVTAAPVSFAQAGSYSLEVIDSNGQRLKSSGFAVQSPTTAYSQFNVSGVWFEPTSSGSGLFLLHSKKGTNDAIFGGWNNYRQSGESSWFSLQGGAWVSPLSFAGEVHESKGMLLTCFLPVPTDPNCPNALNPIPAASGGRVGSYRLDVISESSAEITFKLDSGPTTRKIRLQKILQPGV